MITVKKSEYNKAKLRKLFGEASQQYIQITEEEAQELGLIEQGPIEPTGEIEPQEQNKYHGRFIFDFSKHPEAEIIKTACTQLGFWCKIFIEKIDNIYHIKCNDIIGRSEDIICTSELEHQQMINNEGLSIIIGYSPFYGIRCYSAIKEYIHIEDKPAYNKDLNTGIGYDINCHISIKGNLLEAWNIPLVPIITEQQSYLFNSWCGILNDNPIHMGFGGLESDYPNNPEQLIGHFYIEEYLINDNNRNNILNTYHGNYYFDENNDICISYNNKNIKIVDYILDNEHFQGTLIDNQNNYSINFTNISDNISDLFFILVTNKDSYIPNQIRFNEMYYSAGHYTDYGLVSDNYIKLGNYKIDELSFWPNNELCLTLTDLQTGETIVDEHGEYNYNKNTGFFTIKSNLANYTLIAHCIDIHIDYHDNQINFELYMQTPLCYKPNGYDNYPDDWPDYLYIRSHQPINIINNE